jgi:HD-GYP domain-containing protein (c-di-GMP phosphodiesterase class II)
MFWRNENTLLKEQLKDLQRELENEQGKATRLMGFLGRLLSFGVTPSGQAPQRPFAEALIDVVHVLLKADQVVLLESDANKLDFVPVASRGVSPQLISRARTRLGEGVLGRAAQNGKMIVQETTTRSLDDEALLMPPYLIAPLLSQGQSMGLLLVGKPQSGSFSTEDKNLALLLAAQAALVIEDHSFHNDQAHFHDQVVASLARALEARDSYTHFHAERTRALIRAVAQELALPDILIQHIEDGALLHDIGKIAIEDSILKKPGELTPEEYNVMKTHAAIGRRILEPILSLRGAGSIVLYHQEWYNGTGYPEGLAGEEIPLGARIVQIIDAWDAMTSDRSYRKAMPKAAAITELRRQAGTQFDPKLVELFLRVIDRLEREGIPTTEIRREKPLASQRA